MGPEVGFLAGGERVVAEDPSAPAPDQAHSGNYPATPITTAGSYPLSAVVVNPPTGTVTIRWVVAYSNAVLDTVDTGFGPNSYELQVPAGSYRIRVTATPRVGSTTGGAVIVDYPVCTGQGNENAPQHASGLPAGGTDAVDGC